VSYEELFVDATFEQQMRCLDGIYGFLGFPTLDELPPAARDRVLERLQSYLDRSRQKMNTESVYRLIPNVDEIERELASEENGSLFG
jgi:hypothetical protein